MKRSALIFAAMMASGAAVAAEEAKTAPVSTTPATTTTTFSNNLNSTLIVSPAQYYQVEALRNDLQLGLMNNSGEAKFDGGKSTTKLTGNELNVDAIYNIQGAGARVGLTLDYGTMKGETKTTGADTSKTDYTSMNLAPVGTFTVADAVVVGASINLLQNSSKAEGGKEVKFSHTIVQPGVLYKNNQLEAGLTLTGNSKAKTKVEGVEVEQELAGATTLHGRYAVNDTMAAGAIVTNQSVTKAEKESSNATNNVKGTFEYGMEAVKLEGTLGMTTAGYKKKENMSTDNISTMEIGGAADYAVNPSTVVGGGLTYEWGSEKNAGVTYAKSDVGFAVRGKMSF